MQGELGFEDWWSMERLLITGSRSAGKVLLPLLEIELARVPKNTIIAHGGARGIDRMFGDLAVAAGYSVMEYKANWTMYGRAAGHIRNELMLDEFKPDRVLAFWDGESRGTLNCMQQARRRGKLVRVVYTVPFPKQFF